MGKKQHKENICLRNNHNQQNKPPNNKKPYIFSKYYHGHFNAAVRHIHKKNVLYHQSDGDPTKKDRRLKKRCNGTNYSRNE